MSKKKRSQRLVRYRVGGGNEDAFAKGRTARLAQVFDVRIVAVSYTHLTLPTKA